MIEPTKLKVVLGTHGRFLTVEGDFISLHLQKFGAHTRNEIAFLSSVVRDGDEIVDLGAHIGSFTVPLAKKAGRSGRVLAIEANPDTFRLLESNVIQNGLDDRVTCINAAIGVEGQTGRFKVDEGNSGSNMVVLGEGEVFLRGLGGILDKAGFTGPNVIKIDIQGMEAIILTDIMSVLVSVKPALYFEVSGLMKEYYGDNSVVLGEALKNIGYRFFRNVGQRNSSNDTFVIAELEDVPPTKGPWDCLAIHRDSDRIIRLDSSS